MDFLLTKASHNNHKDVYYIFVLLFLEYLKVHFFPVFAVQDYALLRPGVTGSGNIFIEVLIYGSYIYDFLISHPNTFFDDPQPKKNYSCEFQLAIRSIFV